jgi:hypothetical protein
MNDWKTKIWEASNQASKVIAPYQGIFTALRTASESISEASRASTTLGAVAAVSSLVGVVGEIASALDKSLKPDGGASFLDRLSTSGDQALAQLLLPFASDKKDAGDGDVQLTWMVDGHIVLRAMAYDDYYSVEWSLYNEELFRKMMDQVWAKQIEQNFNWLNIETDGKNQRGDNRALVSFRSISNESPVGNQFKDLDLAFERAKSRSRSVLALIGPTGAGKTSAVLSRYKKEKVLSIRVRESWALSGLITLIEVLRPDVLVFDDVELTSSFSEPLARTIEICGEFVPMVIMTYMKDDIGFEKLKPGDVYWPGLRPGRVDDLIVIHPPNLDDRLEILGHFQCPAEHLRQAAEESEGLTGAFLKELAFRVKQGFSVSDSIWRLRLQAPRGFTQTKSGDEKDDDTDQ